MSSQEDADARAENEYRDMQLDALRERIEQLEHENAELRTALAAAQLEVDGSPG